MRLDGAQRTLRKVSRTSPSRKVKPAAAGLALLTAHQGGTILARLLRCEEPLARALDDVIARLTKP